MTNSRVAVMLVASALAAAMAAAQTTPPWQALVGSWKLNTTLSDSPSRDDAGAGQRPGPPASGRFPGGEELGGTGPGGPGDDRPPQGPPAFAKALRIELLDEGIRITSDDGHSRELVATGVPVERQRGGTTVTETVTWQTDRLVIVDSASDRPAMTETFGLAEDGSGRLIHTIQLPDRGSSESHTVKWVYDRNTAGSDGGK
ncbi:MAG: hypothetical protein ABR961_14265 [Thermoanaerobaculaceae bacterium]|jgi:hypothetical protein